MSDYVVALRTRNFSKGKRHRHNISEVTYNLVILNLNWKYYIIHNIILL